MISSNRNPRIQSQQIEIAINQRGGGTTVDESTLPYDPANTSDENTEPQNIAPNYIDNSDFDFSKDDYINSPPVGGDAALESYNWFRQRFIKVTDAVIAGAPSTNVASAAGPFKAAYTYPMDFVLLNGDAGGVALQGTLTRVDDNNATLSTAAQNNIASGGVMWFGESLAESSAHALKATGHSTFAANEGTNTKIPRWDKVNGWLEAGSDTADKFDFACPLALNFIRGGLTFYFRCIVAIRAGSATGNPIRLSVGVWDATASQKRFIESSNLDLTVSPVGTTGATTYKYRVLADMDDGTTIASDEVTIANGNAVLSTSNYNRLTWVNATGIVNLRIYRQVGGVIKRVFTIRNGAQDFNDFGSDEGETPPSLPTAGVLRPIAYKVSTQFNPTSETDWILVKIKLEIPSTYDTSQTSGKQWMRVAVEGDTADERMITLDRISLSLSDGGWQRSARDLNRIQNQNPSSTPTTTTQGNTGVGTCFTLDTPVVLCDRDGTNQIEVPIGAIDPDRRDQFILDCNRVRRILRVRDGETRTLIRCRLSNSVEWKCSETEKFVTSRTDKRGTRIDQLTFGDTILSWHRWRVRLPYIKRYERIHLTEPITVRTLSLAGGNTFLVGASTGWRGALERIRNEVRKALSLEPQFTKAKAHNEKPSPGNEF
jgi:hypothetical protein